MRLKSIIRVLCVLVLAVIVINFVIIWGSMRMLKVYEHTVYFADLPNHLEGVRILQISDLHNRSEYSQTLNIWPQVSRLQFDMVAITGDIILGGLPQLEPLRQDLKELAERVPVFFVEGNHEWFWEFRGMGFAPFMEEVGITYLFDQRTTIDINGGPIDIIGTRDFRHVERYSRLDQTYIPTLFAPSNNFQLVLTHRPETIDFFDHTNVNFVLSGHTHGGQIRLPFVDVMYAPGQGFWPRFGEGFYDVNGIIMYVSRGVGATYFPVRYWNRPVISIFELRGK